MELYHIKRAKEIDLRKDRADGLTVYKSIKRKKRANAQRRYAQVSKYIANEECTLSSSVCPEHSGHRAINTPEGLVCPFTYFIWKAWVALESEDKKEMAKVIDFLEKTPERIIVPYGDE